MALFWRIWIAISAVNFAVLALFVFLTALQFDSVNSGLLGERLTVLGSQTAAPFEAAAKIGLPLSTVRNAEALLERAKQTDDDILGIVVFDEHGLVVHGSNAFVDSVIPEELLIARDEAAGAPWQLVFEKRFYSSTDILFSDGRIAGGILITYPTQSNITQIRAMVAEIGLTSIVIFIGSVGFSGLLLRLGLRRQIRSFDAFDEVVVEFERGAWRSAAMKQAGMENENQITSDLRSLLDSAEARYRSTGHAIEQLQRNATSGTET